MKLLDWLFDYTEIPRISLICFLIVVVSWIIFSATGHIG